MGNLPVHRVLQVHELLQSRRFEDNELALQNTMTFGICAYANIPGLSSIGSACDANSVRVFKLSLLDLAILGGNGDSADVISRTKLARISLSRKDLDGGAKFEYLPRRT